MKNIFTSIFISKKSAVSVDGTVDPTNRKWALFQGVLVGTLFVAGFFFFVSFVQGTKFQQRFLQAFSENQRSVIMLSKNEFTPLFSQLLVSLDTIWKGGEAPGIFVQLDDVIASSGYITTAAEKAKNEFPFDDFSSDEQRKINNFYVVLGKMDNGRHVYVLSLKNCVRFSVDGDANAEEYCETLENNWQIEAAKLLKELVGTLELSEKDSQLLEGIL